MKRIVVVLKNDDLCRSKSGVSILIITAMLMLIMISICSASELLIHHHASMLEIADDGRTIFIGGMSNGSLSDNGLQGSADAWLASYNSQGRQRWIYHYKQFDNDALVAMAIDKDQNLYMTGYSRNNENILQTWVSKYDRNNNHIVTKTFPLLNEDDIQSSPSDIIVDTNNDIIISGFNKSAGGDTNGWIMKLNSMGKVIWLKSIGQLSHDFSVGLTQITSGLIILAGNTKETIDNNADHGDNYIWLAAFDSSGTQIWTKSYSSGETDFVTDIETDRMGGFYLTGYTFNSDPQYAQNLWLARYSSSGNMLWFEKGDDTNHNTSNDLAVDFEGNPSVAGNYFGEDRINTDHDERMFLMAFDKDGDYEFFRFFDSSKQQFSSSMKFDKDGNLYISGTSISTDDNSDAFLMKLSGRHQILWEKNIQDREPADKFSFQKSLLFKTQNDLTLRKVKPSTTDSSISTKWNNPHYIYLDENQTANQALFVFLSGSYSKPSSYQYILKQAAMDGYYAVGLSYPNSWTVGSLCNDIYTEDCFWAVRKEIITGENLTDVVDISYTDSITNRMVKLLSYLQAQYPSENWHQWLSGQRPKWSNMIVAGHSQGGGHSAAIGKMNNVRRVLMFGAPEDVTVDGTSPSWLSSAGNTPASRYFGFCHVNDPFWDSNIANWKVIGLPVSNGIMDVDIHSSYTGNRQFKTSEVPSSGKSHGLDAHGAVVSDLYTPIINNLPVYEIDKFWTFMISGE